jgi:hypothetical protein
MIHYKEIERIKVLHVLKVTQKEWWVPKTNVLSIVTILLFVFEVTYQAFFVDTHIYRRKWSMNLDPLTHLGQNPFYKTYLPISYWPLNTEILALATLGTSSL